MLINVDPILSPDILKTLREMGHGDRPRPSNFMRNINVMHGNQQVFNKKVNPGGGDCGCG